jgi:hypothetical protein
MNRGRAAGVSSEIDQVLAASKLTTVLKARDERAGGVKALDQIQFPPV